VNQSWLKQAIFHYQDISIILIILSLWLILFFYPFFTFCMVGPAWSFIFLDWNDILFLCTFYLSIKLTLDMCISRRQETWNTFWIKESICLYIYMTLNIYEPPSFLLNFAYFRWCCEKTKLCLCL
jgi:hypothetical protein